MSDKLVCPLRGTPLVYHWNESGALPPASTTVLVKAEFAPIATDTGCCLIVGGIRLALYSDCTWLRVNALLKKATSQICPSNCAPMSVGFAMLDPHPMG